MVMGNGAINNLTQERNKANLLENFVYVSGVGVGSVLLADGLKRIFRKEATLKEKVLGVLGSFLGGFAALESAHLLIKQQPMRVSDSTVDAAIWGGMMAGMDF